MNSPHPSESESKQPIFIHEYKERILNMDGVKPPEPSESENLNIAKEICYRHGAHSSNIVGVRDILFLTNEIKAALDHLEEEKDREILRFKKQLHAAVYGGNIDTKEVNELLKDFEI